MTREARRNRAGVGLGLGGGDGAICLRCFLCDVFLYMLGVLLIYVVEAIDREDGWLIGYTVQSLITYSMYATRDCKSGMN